MRRRFTLSRGWFNPNPNPNPFLSLPQQDDIHLFKYVFNTDVICVFGSETVLDDTTFFRTL